jgi:hypothetical protein
MLILALLAGSMDWKMQRHLQSMSTPVQSAFCIAVFDVLEHLEGYQFEKKAEEEEKAAIVSEKQADQLGKRSETEHVSEK